MTTLVIHPYDISTNFLDEIYISNKEWKVITKNVSKSYLKREIKNHDRIIFLGHGTELGLLDINNKRYVIDSTFVYLLKKKKCIYVWCNADKFINKYGLKGFYTGMIISEINEAVDNCIMTNSQQLQVSNILFTKSLRDAISFSDNNNSGKINSLRKG